MSSIRPFASLGSFVGDSVSASLGCYAVLCCLGGGARRVFAAALGSEAGRTAAQECEMRNCLCVRCDACSAVLGSAAPWLHDARKQPIMCHIGFSWSRRSLL
jgi:hypothetical protein